MVARGRHICEFASILIYLIAEVEMQLNNKPATTPQLPSKKQRNGSSSSAHKHQHQASDPTQNSSLSSPRTGQSLDSESQPMLSTFGSRSSQPTPTSELLTPAGSQGLLTTKSTVVQLRRNTNKLGRQAPTTPKRTRIRLYKPYICQKKKFFV